MDLFVFFFVVALIQVALVVLWRATGQGPLGDGGTCGACGYAVKGLTSFRCPECGADLQKVGITPPARRGRSKAVWALIVLGVALEAMMLAGLAMFTSISTVSNTATPVAMPTAAPATSPPAPAVPAP